MKLAINTFVYEVGKWSIRKTFESARKMGFTHMEFAAWESHDPTRWSKQEQKDFVAMFKDNGLKCSQMLLADTERVADPDPKQREKTLDYMKKCAEIQHEMGGGKQVLVCWGCGVHQQTMAKEQAWLNMVDTLRRYAEWGLDKGVLIDLELDPHVYFVVNDTAKMVKAIEDIDKPNVFPNIDIGHLFITREPAKCLEKYGNRILHIHLSETDTYAHTNSILGTGKVDFKTFVDKCMELGIEDNCKRYGETAVAGIEMGEPGGEVDDPERWVKESIEFLKKALPGVSA